MAYRILPGIITLLSASLLSISYLFFHLKFKRKSRSWDTEPWGSDAGVLRGQEE